SWVFRSGSWSTPWTVDGPSSQRSMTTSSSERGRCTRISPSAVLDDRLESKDLEWALDHLKSCDVCRDRVEEFREIVVRVDRPPFPLEYARATPVHEVALDSHREEARPIGEETKAEESPPLEPDARREARVATMTRVPVGLVAAACVVLAGLLYVDGGLLTAF